MKKIDSDQWHSYYSLITRLAWPQPDDGLASVAGGWISNMRKSGIALYGVGK
jgi:hypothetical protein